MPHKHTVRKYAPGHYYHVYNRGVEKRDIFQENNDYETLLSIIKSYLTPRDFGKKQESEPTWRSKLDKNEVEMICYCLMPNHFHFLIKQNKKDGITRFMRRVSNSYVKFFNKKYDRVGTLYQGKFKAALVENDNYLLHLSRYIHLNPLEICPREFDKNTWIKEYPYSSYIYFTDSSKSNSWLKPGVVLNFFKQKKQTSKLFKNHKTYKSFVENYKLNSSKVLGNIILE